MSYLITSSNQNEYDDSSIGDGITKASSYINYMRSPLVIEPNSEIAVQSIKCSRPNVVTLAEEMDIGFFFGNDDQTDITIQPQLPVFANIEAGTYSQLGFASELQRSLKSMWQSTYNNASDVTVALKQATLSTVGFDIAFQQSSTLATSSAVSLDKQPMSAVNDLNKIQDGVAIATSKNFTYNTATQELTHDEDAGDDGTFDCVAIFKEHPLRANGGSVEFDLNTSAYPEGFKVGLTRGVTANAITPDLFPEDEAEGLGPADFYDFSVEWDGEGGDLEARQYEAGAGMEEVSASFVITSASMTGTGVQKIKFTRTGENIKVETFDKSNGNVYKVWVDNGDFKPCGLPTEMLYVKVDIFTDDDKIKILNFYGRNKSYTPDFLASRLYGLKNEQDARELDNRIDLRTSDFTSPTNITYLGINASNGVANKSVLLLGKSERFGVGIDTGLASYGKVNFNNAMEMLGFDKSVIDQTTYGTVLLLNNVSYSSTTPPTISTTNSLFVRLNNLPHTSFNANKGSISKILYALPRIDLGGKTFGVLYFEPTERVYVKLHNSSAITMTDISVDIVNFNEQVAEDLNGNTITCFHIRKSN